MQSSGTEGLGAAPSRVRVALVRTGPDLAADVRAAMEAARWREHVPEGASLAVKPNLGFDHPLPGAVTSPLVLDAVLQVLRERAAKIFVVEADQVVVDIETSLRNTGTDEVLRRHGVEWVNLSRQPLVEVSVPGALAAPKLLLPEILTRTTLVTVPVMKTHNKTVLSGAIKNQWGCLPTFRHNYHPVVHEVLRDLSSVLRPRFAVLDGTVALEGNGPKSGRPRVMNLVLASGDPVAVDRVSARIMGLEHLAIRHLDLCGAAGIGRNDPAAIDVVDGSGNSCKVPTQSFVPAKHNTVSFVEQSLRRPMLAKLLFETPLLWPLCVAARTWYFCWYHWFGGKAEMRRAAHESPYGAQWLR